MEILYYLLLCMLISSIVQSQMIINPMPIAEINMTKLYGLPVRDISLTIDNNYICVSSEEKGFDIIDISDFSNPIIIHNENYKSIGLSSVSSVLVFGIHLAVVDRYQGVRIYNIQDIKQIKLLSFFTTKKELQLFIVTSDYKYGFTIGNGIVNSIDLSTITSPQLLSSASAESAESYKLHFFKEEQYLSIANGNGACIIDIRDKLNLKSRYEARIMGGTFDFFVLNDGVTGLVAEFYYGIYIADISALYSTTNKITLTWNSLYRFDCFMMSIGISSDNNFIFAGLRSVGVFLFSYQNQQINLIERIPGDHLQNRIIFSNNNNDNNMFVATGISVVIYERSEPNFNKDFPNLFNSFQSAVSAIGQTQVPWTIRAFSDNKRLAIALAQAGAKIVDISDPYAPVDLYKFEAISEVSFDGVTLSKDEMTLYIGASQNGIYSYNISDLTNVLQLSHQVPIPQKADSNDSDEIIFDQSENLGIISNGYSGIQLVDYSDKRNPKPIYFWYNNSIKGSFEKSIITADNMFIYSACRDYGVVAFYYDKANKIIKLIDALPKQGTEQLVFSQDQNYIFAANGYSGFLILDITNKQKLILVTQLILDGWIQQVIVLTNEKYALLAHIENGQISLLDISDKTNPFVISEYRNKGENAISMVQSIDLKSLFFIGSMGLRYLPLEIDLTIHTQQRLVMINKNTNEQTYSQIPTNQSFKVGQNIQLTFVPVKTGKDVLIQDVNYYENFEIKPIPFWMKYVQLTQSLTLTIDKSATLTTLGFNTIILQTLVQIEAADFVTSGLIDIVLAKQILKCLVQQEYVDSNSYLKSKFDPKLTFQLNFFDNVFLEANYAATENQIQLAIKKKLIVSSYQYPVQFKVESSLKLNINPLDTEDIISSSSNYVYIYLTIVDNKGKFVERVYQGALVSFSQDAQTVKIEGPLDGVNAILKNKLKLATKVDVNNIQIQIKLQDNANYDINTVEILGNISFISLHSKVTLAYPLQQQVNKQYDNGDLTVEEKFSIKLYPNTFQNEDTQSVLTYTAQIEVDGQWQELTSLNWIDFNSLELIFQGQKSRYALYSTERIKIIATDSHTSAEDQFKIVFNQIPITLILSIVVQILGPLIGFLGLFSYRSAIYMGQNYHKILWIIIFVISFQLIKSIVLKSFLYIFSHLKIKSQISDKFFCKSSYYYSREATQVGKIFHKEVFLIKNYQLEIQALWIKINQVDKYLLSDIRKQYQESKKIDLTNLLAAAERVYQKENNLYPNIDEQQFKVMTSRFYKIARSQVVLYLLQSDKNTNSAFKYFLKHEKNKSQTKDWYQSCAIIYNRQAEFYQSMGERDTIGKPSVLKNYNSFPEITLKTNYINGIIYLSLLNEQITNEILGYNQFIYNRLNPCKGLSIFLNSSQILSISAYQKTVGCCYCLRKRLSIHYQPIGLNRNNLLPSWLNCKIKDDSLHIFGTPQIEDVGEILIRIYDSYDLAIMQFKLIVQEKVEQGQSFIRPLVVDGMPNMRPIELSAYQGNKQVLDIGQQFNQQNNLIFNQLQEPYLNVQRKSQFFNDNPQYAKTQKEEKIQFSKDEESLFSIDDSQGVKSSLLNI